MREQVTNWTAEDLLNAVTYWVDRFCDHFGIKGTVDHDLTGV